MKDYIILDIETPNVTASSICSIAVVIVKNNKITNKLYSLINPEESFDELNTKIHGISRSNVINSPTVNKYWDNIKGLFKDNVVVGHNITFDLNVLTKALNKYDIELPTIKYIDTMLESKKYMPINSYKLTDVCTYINYKYDAHNALEDAIASYEVLNFMLKKYYTDLTIQNFTFNKNITKSYDNKLDANLNELYGLIQGINYDEIINEYEIDTLKDWIKRNNKNKNYNIIDSLINKLNIILDDNYISEYEKETLLKLCSPINESKTYTRNTLEMQMLRGILKGIICDNKINEYEINSLNNWLLSHTFLKGIYPYDKVTKSISQILKDEIITEDEKKNLLDTIEEIINPVKEDISDNKITFENKTFCLTGDFKYGTKEEVTIRLEQLGGTAKTGVSSKLNYLIVGGLGSDKWKYGNAGGKIAQAKAYQEKGNNILIIPEDEMTF